MPESRSRGWLLILLGRLQLSHFAVLGSATVSIVRGVAIVSVQNQQPVAAAAECRPAEHRREAADGRQTMLFFEEAARRAGRQSLASFDIGTDDAFVEAANSCAPPCYQHCLPATVEALRKGGYVATPTNLLINDCARITVQC